MCEWLLMPWALATQTPRFKKRERHVQTRMPGIQLATEGLPVGRGYEKMNIPRSVIGFLSSRGLVIATAESCTGGMIASLLADVPGSGPCLDVGIVAYSPSGKRGFLNVRAETIELHGLTSEAVAREMAAGLAAMKACPRANRRCEHRTGGPRPGKLRSRTGHTVLRMALPTTCRRVHI